MAESTHDSPTFEKVWQMFQETNRETNRKWAETDKRFKDTDKKLRKLEYLFTSQWGKLVESLVEGDLVNILRNRNIDVQMTTTRQKKIHEGRQYEIDIIAVNKTEAVVVEVKTTLRPKDVKEFLAELKVFKTVFPLYSRLTIYGAVAFLRADGEADFMATKNGLFTIKATGNSALITNPDSFIPKAF